jgi:hypothetical protein
MKNIDILKLIINESIIKENIHLIEGIDVDYINKVVSFNDDHQENVDTSTIINPTYYKINDIDVISIFKRKKSEEYTLDGNPLIYALKGIKGWKINDKMGIINLLRKFIRISEKIKEKYDTVITIPSTNELNVNFLHRLSKIIKSKYQINDFLDKLTINEVYENYIDWNSMNNDFGGEFPMIQRKMNKFFTNMEKDNNHYFSYKYIQDVRLRKYITKTMEVDNEKIIEYSSYINGKDILILDDTIGSGTSISEATRAINNTFVPKSITVITLFSKLD